MKTEHLRINQLSPEAYQWYLDYLQAMDAQDVEQYSSFLADDCVMRFNNDDPVQSKAAIVPFLTNYWTTFSSIEHDLLNIYGNDSAFVLEALNHYTRPDGKTVTLRAVAFTDRNSQGLVTSVRLYTDTSPLFS